MQYLNRGHRGKVAEDVAAIRRGLCGPETEEECRDEVGQENLEWTCKQCPKKKADDLHPYTAKLIELLAMQRGGYPFQADDLTRDEWIDLGRLKEALEKPKPTGTK